MDTFENKHISEEPAGEVIGETERLIIRELTVADVPVYKHLADVCEGGIDPSLKNLPLEEFTERHRAYIKYQYGFYGYGNWGLFLRDGTFVGIVGVHNSDESMVGEIGYAVLPKYRRRGYATEAVAYVLPYSLEDIGFLSIVARIDKDNIPSLAIAKRFGIKII